MLGATMLVGTGELVEVVVAGTVVVVVDEVVVEVVVEAVVEVVLDDAVEVVLDDGVTTVPAPAILTWCWALFGPAVARRKQVWTPQLNVVAPVLTMRFVAKAVGGMVPAAVVTNGVLVVGSHCGAVTVPPHCRMVPTELPGNPLPVTVTTCPSESPVEGLTVRVTLGSVPVCGVSAKAGA